mgnify:CR=1 FL=1
MNIIAIIHFIYIVLFVVVPFITNNPLYLAMHIVFGIGMVFHWIMNSDICFLTWLEHKLFNVPINKTFMDRLVGAVYRISDKQVQYATYFLFIFSICKLIYLWTQTKLSFLDWIAQQ